MAEYELKDPNNIKAIEDDDDLKYRRLMSDRYEEFVNLLFHFLDATYYPGMTDEDTIRGFVAEMCAESIAGSLKEGRELLQLQPFPWEWVSGVANGLACNPGEEKLYTNEQLAIRWVRWMMEALEAEAKRAGKL